MVVSIQGSVIERHHSFCFGCSRSWVAPPGGGRLPVSDALWRDWTEEPKPPAMVAGIGLEVGSPTQSSLRSTSALVHSLTVTS